MFNFLNTSITVKHAVLKIALSKPFPVSCWAKLSPRPQSHGGGPRYDKSAISHGLFGWRWWLLTILQHFSLVSSEKKRRLQIQRRAGDSCRQTWWGMERANSWTQLQHHQRIGGTLLMKGCNQVARANLPHPAAWTCPNAFLMTEGLVCFRKTIEVLKLYVMHKEWCIHQLNLFCILYYLNTVYKEQVTPDVMFAQSVHKMSQWLDAKLDTLHRWNNYNWSPMKRPNSDQNQTSGRTNAPFWSGGESSRSGTLTREAFDDETSVGSWLPGLLWDRHQLTKTMTQACTSWWANTRSSLHVPLLYWAKGQLHCHYLM